MKEKKKAVNFKLEGDDGKAYSLEDFQGKKLVLYFYPKDNTSGCTLEAEEFSALRDKFADKDAVIVGVSPDSIKSHQSFKEKAGINFLLLSDPSKEIAMAYGAYGEKSMYGKKYMGIIRSTFVIENSEIIQSWLNVKAKGHAENVYCELK